MSALTSPLLLAALLAVHSAAGPFQDTGEGPDTDQDAAAQVESADETANRETDEAARAALREAPRRSKLGRLRGLRVTSEVRFASTPDDPYSLIASFGIPDRTRVVLANQNGSFGRFQLGTRVFGRDVQTGNEAASYVLTGAAAQETLIDFELRRALFLWPDAPVFTGAGRTYTTQIGDFGILMATVDETTGLPNKIESFGKEGGAGASFDAIQWGPADGDGRARPTSLTFAAGGQAIWTETIQHERTDWRFADTWFLPADRLTAVMGSKVAKQLHVRALEGAWTHTVDAFSLTETGPTRPFATFPTGNDGVPTDLAAEVQAGAEWWDVMRRRIESLPGSHSVHTLSPYVSLVLDNRGAVAAFEYELLDTKHEQDLSGSDWSWRAATNIWAYPLETPKSEAPLKGVALASKALAVLQGDDPEFKTHQKLRFRVGEERLGAQTRVIALDFALTVDIPQQSDETPAETPAEKTPSDKR